MHGTSGGRAERVEGARQRRTVKTEHHALLGSYFLTHPPICECRVEVSAADSPLTRGLGTSFVVEDEPYFVELQDPGSTQILLTADYGPNAASPASTWSGCGSGRLTCLARFERCPEATSRRWRWQSG